MKVFYITMVLGLLGTLVLPFFMKGPEGKPLMTKEQLASDSLSALTPDEPTVIYRWQNEHGVWQFGESAPEHAVATKLSVDTSRTMTMGSEWIVSEKVGQTGASDPVNFEMPNSLTDSYRAAPELMGAAERAAEALNGRQEEMDKFLQQINKNNK